MDASGVDTETGHETTKIIVSSSVAIQARPPRAFFMCRFLGYDSIDITAARAG